MKWLKIPLIVLVLVWAAVLTVPDKNLHVVVCDVGQGDAILVWSGQNQALIDGGPTGKRAAQCLARYMPFWDNTVELVVLTHPDADHAGGLPAVFDRYTVLQFVSVPVGKDSDVYRGLVEKIRQEKSAVANVYGGDVVRIGGADFEVIWPERDWVAARVTNEESTVSSFGGAVLGAKTRAEVNDFSVGGILAWGEFEMLLSGDGDDQTMAEQVRAGRLKQVEVAKVPHHGSKYAAARDWWAEVRPQMAVVSVGKNSYGHPAGELTKLLTDLGIKIARTDQQGDIQIVSNGREWWVK